MNTMKRLSTLAIAALLFAGLYAQDKKQLMEDFVSADWKKIKVAKSGLENMQGDIMPDLIKLLDNTDKVKLENAGSLIYPGAEKFFGHGQILDYDVDYLTIRAGWLIEELSFNNFGFSGIHLPEDMMATHIKMTFPEYYNNSSNRKKLEAASSSELREIAQEQAVQAVNDWWKSENGNFSRLSELVEALKSFDEKRQVKALFYMRNGVTKCEGLSKEYYYEEIAKEIVRLSGSEVKRIAEHAKLILLDSKLDWLEMKNQ